MRSAFVSDQKCYADANDKTKKLVQIEIQKNTTCSQVLNSSSLLCDPPFSGRNGIVLYVLVASHVEWTAFTNFSVQKVSMTILFKD